MDFLGLPLDHSLLVIALILIAIDVFLPTDVPTHIAYVILSYLIGSNLPIPALYQVLVGILAWFAVLTLHFTLWRSFTHRIAHKYIAPTKYKTGMAGLVDQTGVLREIEGQRMVEVHGDLYLCEEQGQIVAESRVRILQARDGRLIVTQDEGK